MTLTEAIDLTKKEINDVLNEKFQSNEETFLSHQIDSFNFSWPVFLIDHTELFKYSKDADLIKKRAKKFNGQSKLELRVNRSELKDQLEDIHSDCQKIFNLIGRALKKRFKRRIREILNSEKSKYQKLEDLERYIEVIRELDASFGLKVDANYFLNEGLIYGNIDRFRGTVLENDGLSDILYKDNLTNQLVPGKLRYNYSTLKELFYQAIPISKDYIAVQYAISNYDELNPVIEKAKKRWALLDKIFQELVKKEALSDQEVLEVLLEYDQELSYRPPKGFFTNEVGKAKKRPFATAFKEIYENSFPGESLTPEAIEDRFNFIQLSI